MRLGCEAVTSEPVRAVRFERPDTLREVRMPILVMFDWATVANDPYTTGAEMAFDA